MALFRLLLFCLAPHAHCLDWDGDYVDADGLQISVSREGNVITARSEQWTNHGAALGREEPPSRVTMEGLHGELSAGGIAWDNGVLWMRAAAPPQPRAGGVAPPPEAAAPPEAAMVAAWVGQYQDQDGMTISIEAAEPAGAVAASSRQFQQAPGEVHGSLIVMFGVQGKMERGGPIHWENGSVWERVSPPAAGGAAAAAGARAPASTTGDPLAAPPQPAVANRAGGLSWPLPGGDDGLDVVDAEEDSIGMSAPSSSRSAYAGPSLLGFVKVWLRLSAAVLVLALCGGPPALALHSWLKHGVVSQANLAADLRILAATAGAAGAAARECAAQAVPEHVRRRLRHVSAYAKVNAGPDDAEAGGGEQGGAADEHAAAAAPAPWWSAAGLRERGAAALAALGGGAVRRGAASAAVEEDYPFDAEVMVEKTSWEVDRSRVRPSKEEAATSQADGASE